MSQINLFKLKITKCVLTNVFRLLHLHVGSVDFDSDFSDLRCPHRSVRPKKRLQRNRKRKSDRNRNQSFFANVRKFNLDRTQKC